MFTALSNIMAGRQPMAMATNLTGHTPTKPNTHCTQSALALQIARGTSKIKKSPEIVAYLYFMAVAELLSKCPQ